MVDPVPAEAIRFCWSVRKAAAVFLDQMPQQLFEGGYYWRVTIFCLFVCFLFVCLFVCFWKSTHINNAWLDKVATYERYTDDC